MKEMAQGLSGADGGSIDADTKASIRNLDRSLARMVDDVSHGRGEIIKEVRSEIKLLARTIANIAEGDYER